MKGSIMNRLTTFVVAALVAAVTAQAQDWAKARLEKSPRHLEWVKVKHGDREVTCFIAYPEVKDKATAVVVIHEIFGLSDWVRGVTDQLAEAGYIAIAPDRSEEHTSELQSRGHLVCRLLLEKKK